MSIHTLPVYVPFDALEALGKFTGNWWSDTYALEPFIIEAIGNYIKAPAAEQQPAAPSSATRCRPIAQRRKSRSRRGRARRPAVPLTTCLPKARDSPRLRLSMPIACRAARRQQKKARVSRAAPDAVAAVSAVRRNTSRNSAMS